LVRDFTDFYLFFLPLTLVNAGHCTVGHTAFSFRVHGIHRVSEKRTPLLFYDNFGKSRSVFIFFTAKFRKDLRMSWN